MSKKPVKPTSTATVPKPKPPAKPAVEEKIDVQRFNHSCSNQKFALVWLDENLNQEDPICRELTSALRKIINKLDAFNNTDNCLEFIKKISSPVLFLIVSNPTEKMVDSVHRVPQVTKIFIFNTTGTSKDSWGQRWRKIEGIYRSIESLSQSLKNAARILDDDYQEFHVVSFEELERREFNNTKGQKHKEIDRSFMYIQLIKEILLEMEYENDAPEQLVKYCRKHQEELDKVTDQLKDLDEFRNYYGKDKRSALVWYTAETFLYKMVNWALNAQKFEPIIQTGFFIKAVYEQLADRHKRQRSAGNAILTLYRGQGMKKEEFEQLERNKGGLFVFNGFMSTSAEPSVSEDFARRKLEQGHGCAVLFTITVDKSASNAVFADIRDLSALPDEKETLFALGTVFRIGRISLHTQWPGGRNLWNVELELHNAIDEQLNQLMNYIRQQIAGPTPLYRLGAFLLKVAENKKADEIFRRDLELATDDQHRANIHYHIGFAFYNQGDATEALDHYRTALNIYRKCSNSTAVQNNIASIYNNIGLAYSHVEDHKKSLKYYQAALAIYEKLVPDSLTLATCYNNIASCYEKLDDYKKAKSFYQKSSDIHEKQSVPNNPELATLENNIGLLCMRMGNNPEAAKRFANAVRIGTKCLLNDNPTLAIYKKHLETMKHEQEKYK